MKRRGLGPKAISARCAVVTGEARTSRKRSGPEHPGGAGKRRGRVVLEVDKRGRFITFEGGEGVGKSTQAARLAARLTDCGIDVRTLREPGGDPFAEAGRALLLGDTPRALGNRSMVAAPTSGWCWPRLVPPVSTRWSMSDATQPPAPRRWPIHSSGRQHPAGLVHQGEVGLFGREELQVGVEGPGVRRE